MSRIQFIESARSADGRPTLDLQGQMAYLRDEWRLMLRPETMAADAPAGIAVALVALPLSLAIATASGVEPEVGLVTAIVGGIAVALFGGSRLQVSGPAAAMTFLVAEVVAKHSMSALVVATLIAALLQYVNHNMVADTQEQADALPTVAADWERLRAEVVEVN
jgi:hypothetical protein